MALTPAKKAMVPTAVGTILGVVFATLVPVSLHAIMYRVQDLAIDTLIEARGRALGNEQKHLAAQLQMMTRGYGAPHFDLPAAVCHSMSLFVDGAEEITDPDVPLYVLPDSIPIFNTGVGFLVSCYEALVNETTGERRCWCMQAYKDSVSDDAPSKGVTTGFRLLTHGGDVISYGDFQGLQYWDRSCVNETSSPTGSCELGDIPKSKAIKDPWINKKHTAFTMHNCKLELHLAISDNADNDKKLRDLIWVSMTFYALLLVVLLGFIIGCCCILPMVGSNAKVGAVEALTDLGGVKAQENGP